MHDGSVARMKPPAHECLFGRRRIVVVPFHHYVATRDDFAQCCSVVRHFIAVAIHDAQLA
jgi:hypothetical protein